MHAGHDHEHDHDHPHEHDHPHDGGHEHHHHDHAHHHDGGGGFQWGSAVWGGFILFLGIWWLLGEVGALPFEWAWAGPLALIAVGASMLIRRLTGHKDGCCCC